MPPRKNSKKNGRKRKYKRKNASIRNTLVAVRPSATIVPPRAIVKLRYCESFELNSAGTLVTRRYRANDLFDPLAETGGHQPMGFDQWMVFYNHFTVVGSRITVVAASTGAAATNNVLVGVHLNDDINWSPGSASELMETPYISYKHLGTIDSGRSVVRSAKNFSASKFFGKTKSSIIGDGLYRGDATQSPSEDAVYHVFVHPTIDSDDPAAVDITIQIDYIAYLTEPKTMGQS